MGIILIEFVLPLSEPVIGIARHLHRIHLPGLLGKGTKQKNIGILRRVIKSGDKEDQPPRRLR